MSEISASGESVLMGSSLTVTRGDHVEVLRDLDLDVRRGEVVAVQGSSGVGKSTLLHALCGLVDLDAGTLRVDGNHLDGATDRVRSAVRLESFGLVFQGDELLPELTIGENVSLPMRLLGKRAGVRASDHRAAAEEALTRLGISELIDRMPSQVSGGQLQRASIARAIIHGPRVVLADEPTASLDQVAARAAIALLVELARSSRTAVVLVTHDNAIADLCDRTLRLVDGQLMKAELSGSR